jgi:hypothetical protein
MGNWFKSNIWGLIIGLAVGALATAVAISNAADSLYGQNASPSASVIDARYPAARTETQLALFAASQKACDDIARRGATFTFADESYWLVAGAKDEAGNAVIKMISYSPTGQVRGSGMFNDAPPQPCYPQQLNQQVQRGNSNQASEFLLDVMGNQTFEWHGHLGSADVTNIIFAVSNGTITSFTDLEDTAHSRGSGVAITYGLSAEQLALVQK